MSRLLMSVVVAKLALLLSLAYWSGFVDYVVANPKEPMYLACPWCVPPPTCNPWCWYTCYCDGCDPGCIGCLREQDDYRTWLETSSEGRFQALLEELNMDRAFAQLLGQAAAVNP